MASKIFAARKNLTPSSLIGNQSNIFVKLKLNIVFFLQVLRIPELLLE